MPGQVPGAAQSLINTRQRAVSLFEQRCLPKDAELVAQNKYFLRNLIGSKQSQADTELLAPPNDKYEEQKISIDLGKIRLNQNQSQIFRTSNKTLSRQMQASPTPKLMDFNHERTQKSILSE